jgi:hypothetical protein
MVKRSVSVENVKGYAGGSIATGRIMLPGQTEKCQMKRYIVVLHAGICAQRLLTARLKLEAS